MKDKKIHLVEDKLVKSIKEILLKSRRNVVSRVNHELILTYWHIGKEIVQIEEKYNIDNQSSRQIILGLSKRLKDELGRGFSRSNLFNMRKFFLEFEDVQTVSGHLNWSHICELLIISDLDKRSFYEKEIINSNWSIRELKRQIESSLFERLLLSKGDFVDERIKQLSKDGQSLKNPNDLIKDPYVFEFLGIPEKKPLLEKELEEKLIQHIESFLLELGKGFMFVGSQQRITINNTHFYVDMVFYNKILKSYILIELKMRKLKITDAGQINTYLNYYKTEINDTYDNDPIGIILCTDKDEITAEYILGGLENNVFASKFTYIFPDRDKLIAEVETILKNKQ